MPKKSDLSFEELNKKILNDWKNQKVTKPFEQHKVCKHCGSHGHSSAEHGLYS